MFVYLTETSSKMASTLLQKLLTIFGQKAQNSVYFVLYDFVEISSACGPNTFGEILDLQKIKCPIGKPIFVVNFPLKIFRTTIANDDTESLMSLHTLFDMHLNHMLLKHSVSILKVPINGHSRWALSLSIKLKQKQNEAHL